MFISEGFCPRCAQPINETNATSLEQSTSDGLFRVAGETPESESQGFFVFGNDCAKSILANKGKLVCVGAAKNRLAIRRSR